MGNKAALINVKSVTFWTGIASILIGIAKLFGVEVPGIGQIDPLPLIAQGAGLIGLRRAISTGSSNGAP